MAFARHLLCEGREDSCGRCASVARWISSSIPTSHRLCYPVVKTDSHQVISRDLLGDFTRLLAEGLPADDWCASRKGSSAAIFVAEADP